MQERDTVTPAGLQQDYAPADDTKLIHERFEKDARRLFTQSSSELNVCVLQRDWEAEGSTCIADLRRVSGSSTSADGVKAVAQRGYLAKQMSMTCGGC